MSAEKCSGKDTAKKDWKQILVQFIRFGIIGVGNTVISIVIYYIFVAIRADFYMLGNVIGWIVGVLNSFFWNNRFVFKKSAFSFWKKLLRTYLAYGGSFLVGSATLYLMVSFLHISQWLAPWLNLIVTVPLNFILNKFWAFKA